MFKETKCTLSAILGSECGGFGLRTSINWDSQNIYHRWSYRPHHKKEIVKGYAYKPNQIQIKDDAFIIPSSSLCSKSLDWFLDQNISMIVVTLNNKVKAIFTKKKQKTGVFDNTEIIEKLLKNKKNNRDYDLYVQSTEHFSNWMNAYVPTYILDIPFIEKLLNLKLISLRKVPKQYQTEELCLVAINAYPHELRHVKNQTQKIIGAALSIDLTAVNFIDTDILPIKDWDIGWFQFLTNAELSRQFIKERGKEIYQYLQCLSYVEQNNEYSLISFKYDRWVAELQKALVYRCPSSGDTYFTQIDPSINTINNALSFLNNGLGKEVLAYES